MLEGVGTRRDGGGEGADRARAQRVPGQAGQRAGEERQAGAAAPSRRHAADGELVKSSVKRLELARFQLLKKCP